MPVCAIEVVAFDDETVEVLEEFVAVEPVAPAAVGGDDAAFEDAEAIAD